MTPLSIVHLFTHTDVTRGGAVQGLLLARALQERGHRVVAFFHAPCIPTGQVLADALNHGVTRDLDIRYVDMKSRSSYLRFRWWLWREHIDVIHAHRNLAWRFGYLATCGFSSPVLIANHGTTNPVPKLKDQQVIRHKRVRRIIAVADAVKHALIDAHDIAAQRISVVYGSFDEQSFHPQNHHAGSEVRRTWHVPPGVPLIVSIAAVDRRKGLQVLLRAAPEVLRVYPTATFLFVGNFHHPDYVEALQQDVERLGLTDRVIFTGHRTDVPAILAAADVSVNASTDGEGLTGALRESLAMRKPVVCTAICGNTEIVHDKESGWVVAPGDAPALAHAILEVLGDPDEAARRAAKGYEWVLQHCTNAVRVEQIERIYRSVLETYTSRRQRRKRARKVHAP